VNRREMIVELRSTGLQTVVGPSIHPSGEQYDILSGEPAVASAPMLTACVAALAEAVNKQRHGEQQPAQPVSTYTRPSDASYASGPEVEQRAIAYLSAMPGGISGQGGHSSTYAAATAMVHGFGLDPDKAFDLLWTYHNPLCVPAWSEHELRHKVNDAANKPHDHAYGWLRDSQQEMIVETHGVDLSKFRVREKREDPSPAEAIDPGPFPPHLLIVPGFIGEVTDESIVSPLR